MWGVIFTLMTMLSPQDQAPNSNIKKHVDE